MSAPPGGDETDKNIEMWKIKRVRERFSTRRSHQQPLFHLAHAPCPPPQPLPPQPPQLIKGLEAARGNGTSMISLIMPPKDQVSRASRSDARAPRRRSLSRAPADAPTRPPTRNNQPKPKQVARVQKMLGDEYGTASNIKSRITRLSVLAAITSAQQRLKLYTRVPPNGLVVYTGTVLTEDGKEKKLTIDFEPFKPINTSLYLCDNKFHTEALSELLESDSKYGFIIMDGAGCLFGTLTGNTREILHKFTVDLPKKHGRGGQSAMRFARLRVEKRHNYVRKVAELATQHYITNDRPNVAGLVLAGSADFKTELGQSDIFDQRLQAIVLGVVDVSYGEGFLGLVGGAWGGARRSGSGSGERRTPARARERRRERPPPPPPNHGADLPNCCPLHSRCGHQTKWLQPQITTSPPLRTGAIQGPFNPRAPFFHKAAATRQKKHSTALSSFSSPLFSSSC